MKLKETKIIRSNRRSIAMTITPDATLIVKAPRLLPNFMVTSFVKDHSSWIQKQLEKLEKKPKIVPKTYKNDESFSFLGMELSLVYTDGTQIEVKNNKLLVPKALEFRIQKQLLAWYKKQARIIISQQVDYFSEQMKTSYTGLTFSDTKTQWGSCTHDNKLQFSWRLIMTPITVINYVVVHELAHTTEKNHSRAFWDLVGKHCISYKRQRKWLKDHGNSLII